MSGALAARHTRGGWTLFVTTFLILSLVVPGTVGAGIWDGYTAPTWWAFAVLLVASMELAWLMASGWDRIVSAIFWVYVYVFLGLAPMAQLQARYLPLGGFEQYPDSQLVGASVIVLVGLGAYRMGRTRGRMKVRQRGLEPALFSRQLDPRRVRIVGLISLPLTAAVLSLLRDPLAIIKSQESLTRASTGTVSTSAIQLALLTTPVFMALLFLLASRGARTDRYTPLVVALVVANLVVNNPIANNRTWFGTVAFGLVAAHITFTRTQFRLALAGLLALFIVVFPYADVFRYDDRSAYVASTEPLVSKGDYDSFQQIANGIDRTTDDGFTMGRQLAGSALFWMPRSAWPEKPIDTGVLIAEHQGYEYTNLSAPLWIEGFTDVGIAGVVCLLYAFGRVSERLEHAWLLRRLPGSQLVGLAVPALAAYQMILLRGSLLQACGRLAVMALIVLYCCPLRSQRPTAFARRVAARSGR
jgi:hypothetical protein